MVTSVVSESTPGQPNEDYATVGPDWGIVLDGATAPQGIESGCIHDVPWLVRQLAGNLAHRLTTGASPLPELLAEAIAATCRAHESTCDLDNPSSPSSTVACWRLCGDRIEYLSLADTSIVVDRGVEVDHIVDDRTDHLTDYSPQAVRTARNTPGTTERPSFWVASTKPEAARHAIFGSIPAAEVQRIVLVSDGGARWVDRFRLGNWDDFLDTLVWHGPSKVIRDVRAAELAETEIERAGRRGKKHDDATIVATTFLHAKPRGKGVYVLPNGKVRYDV